MLACQFTTDQNDLIKSYMPGFEAMTLMVDPTLSNKTTTKYRQEKTTEIMSSALFNDEADKKELRVVCLYKSS